MDFGAVTTALQDVLDVMGVIRVYSYMPDNVLPPFFAFYPEPFDYPDSYDGTIDVTFRLMCVAGAVDSQVAQAQLLDWISTGTPDSVRDAIGRNESLNGTVSSARLQRLDRYGPIVLQDGGTRLMSAEFVLDILE